MFAIAIDNSEKKDKPMNTTDLKSFSYLENGRVTFSILDTVKTQKQLDPGVYKLSFDNNGNVLVDVETNEEKVELMNFKNKDRLDEMFKSFFNKKIYKRINKFGFHHKVGIMLYGKQGCGKSTIMKHYYKWFVEEQKALVFQLGNMSSSGFMGHWKFISQIRNVQKNPIVVVADEIDCVFDYNGDGEATVKKCLDGTESIDNCIMLAATNYIHKIPEAVTRPSRFKYQIEMTGVEEVKDIYDIMYKMLEEISSEDDIMKFAQDSKGKTLDEIKHFCFDKLMDLDSEFGRGRVSNGKEISGFE